MRLSVAKKVHYNAGPNLTPLADVALVILIFFMLVGSFGSEHYLTSHTPLVQTGTAKQEGQWLPNEPLEIDVKSIGQDFEATVGQVKTSDPAALVKQLTIMRQNLQRAGTKADDVQVVVAPVKSTKYDHLIRVYESALDAGFPRVAFATARD